MDGCPITGGSGMAAGTISRYTGDSRNFQVEHLEENVAAADLKIDANKWQELDHLARAS
jgi:hypothetical protein